jgi:exodeoxyribonuclease V alpha subunit
MENLSGVLQLVKFHKNGFLIGQLATGEVVLGDLLEPCEGQDYRFSGDWTEHPQWGRQFKFVRYQAELPQTTDGIYRYITRTARWVGPKVGRAIVKAFGEKTLGVLKHDPLRVAACIKGITLERAEEISAALLENEDLARWSWSTFWAATTCPKRPSPGSSTSTAPMPRPRCGGTPMS